jgi:hypothetical protein
MNVIALCRGSFLWLIIVRFAISLDCFDESNRCIGSNSYISTVPNAVVPRASTAVRAVWRLNTGATLGDPDKIAEDDIRPLAEQEEHASTQSCFFTTPPPFLRTHPL